MNDKEMITVNSTSSDTSETNDILLGRGGALSQVYFEASILKNSKEEEKSVFGKLVYDKKKKKDEFDDPTRLSKRSIKVGEMMEISLSSEETYYLYKGLEKRYALYENKGIEYGLNKYVVFDANEIEIADYISDKKEIIREIINGNSTNIIDTLFEKLQSGKIDEDLINQLDTIQSNQVDDLIMNLNFHRIKKLLDVWEKNKTNSSEQFWQNVFEENEWVLGQIFSLPMILFDSGAYVGGKTNKNKEGNLADFVYKNELSNNLLLIEIKKPDTNLIGSAYRNTFLIDKEVVGSVSQVLNYRDSFTKEYYSVMRVEDRDNMLVNPQSVVIVGSLSGLTEKQLKAFDNYRNELKNVQIITYDELFCKVESLIKILTRDIEI